VISHCRRTTVVFLFPERFFFFEFDRGYTEIKRRSWGLARRKVPGNWKGQLRPFVDRNPYYCTSSHHKHAAASGFRMARRDSPPDVTRSTATSTCLASERVFCPQQNLQKMPWQVTGHAATDPAVRVAHLITIPALAGLVHAQFQAPSRRQNDPN
jgi:hypothetical protein